MKTTSTETLTGFWYQKLACVSWAYHCCSNCSNYIGSLLLFRLIFYRGMALDDENSDLGKFFFRVSIKNLSIELGLASIA